MLMYTTTPNSVGKQPGQWPKMGKHSKFYWEKTAEEIASDDELMSLAEENINVTEQYLNLPFIPQELKTNFL